MLPSSLRRVNAPRAADIAFPGVAVSAFPQFAGGGLTLPDWPDCDAVCGIIPALPLQAANAKVAAADTAAIAPKVFKNPPKRLHRRIVTIIKSSVLTSIRSMHRSHRATKIT